VFRTIFLILKKKPNIYKFDKQKKWVQSKFHATLNIYVSLDSYNFILMIYLKIMSFGGSEV